MSVFCLDGALYAEMLRCGAVNLRNNVQTVNELNVFPIPDGDTGENMARTIEGGVAAIDGATVSEVSGALARGMLLSARGNSGVILSQFFEGMRIGFDGVAEAGIPQIKHALCCGVKKAYDAVVTPAEGTILTVMREACDAAAAVSDGDTLENFFAVYIDELYASLDRTPELLPVLKEAGVIDSGGAGFIYIVEGMNRALRGEREMSVSVETAATVAASDKFDADSEMPFGYCTEVIVQLTNSKADVNGYDVKTMIVALENMGGESIVAFKNGTRIKLHVHTFAPDRVLAYCLTVGELVAVKIENMSIQHTETVVRNRFERQKPKQKRKQFACVAVADGAGLIEQFYSLGVDCVVDGKQTMNPSAGDFLSAYRKVNADVIFVLPNNANIIMTARQAAEMFEGSRVVVIESKTLAEGYSAVSMLDYSAGDADKIAAQLTEAVGAVKTGLVTYSVRDCTAGGMKIKKGDFMGFDGKTLLSCSPDMGETACLLIDKIDKSGKAIIIAVRGKDMNDEVVAQKISDHVKANYPELEYYEFDGGQDVYPLIFIIE